MLHAMDRYGPVGKDERFLGYVMRILEQVPEIGEVGAGIPIARVLFKCTVAGETEVCRGTGYFTDARGLFLCCSVCRVVNNCRFRVGFLQDCGLAFKLLCIYE